MRVSGCLSSVKAFKVNHGSWKEAFGYRFETPDKVIKAAIPEKQTVESTAAGIAGAQNVQSQLTTGQ